MDRVRTIIGTIINVLNERQVVVAVQGNYYKELISIDIGELVNYFCKDKLHSLVGCKILCTGREDTNDSCWLGSLSFCEILVNVLDAESVLY